MSKKTNRGISLEVVIDGINILCVLIILTAWFIFGSDLLSVC